MNNVLNWNSCKQDGMNMIVNKEIDKSISDMSCEGAVGYDYDKLEVLMSSNSLTTNNNNKKCLITNSLYPKSNCVDWINTFHSTLTKNEINKDIQNSNNHIDNNNDDNDSNKELNDNVKDNPIVVSPENTSLNDCYRADGTLDPSKVVIEYKKYESELQMQDIMRLIQAELSEPYSIYTYRYFINNWPNLCFLAAHGSEYVGAIVCKLDFDMDVIGGYIAMLAVKKEYRKMKIGTNLVQKAIEEMLINDVEEVVLETEMKNIPALRLYENLGFVRDKRLFRYYLNGVDALRLKLWFR